MKTPHTLKITSALGAPLLNLNTNRGPRWFLLDTGYSAEGFSNTGETIEAGARGLYQDRAVTLSRPMQPVDLRQFSRLIGVEVSGMIGMSYLTQFSSATIHYTDSTLTLGGEVKVVEGAHELELRVEHAPMISVSINGGARTESAIDTGSLFTVVSASAPAQSYPVKVSSFAGEQVFKAFKGTITAQTRGGEQLSAQSALASPPFPLPFNILGAGWLAQFDQVTFDFAKGRLIVTPTQDPAPRPMLQSFAYRAPFVALLKPAEVEQPNRSFEAEALPGRALPAGIRAGVSYTIKGFSTPAGPTGVNDLFLALSAQGPGAVTLVSAQGGEEISVPFEAIWSR